MRISMEEARNLKQAQLHGGHMFRISDLGFRISRDRGEQ